MTTFLSIFKREDNIRPLQKKKNIDSEWEEKKSIVRITEKLKIILPAF